MPQFKVGDTVVLCASVFDFCTTNFTQYFIGDINISLPPCSINTEIPGCLDFSGVLLEFQWTNRGTTEAHDCLDTTRLKNLGSAFTDAQGVASISYTITTDDLFLFQSNINFDLRVCIKNKSQPDVVNFGEVRDRLRIGDLITITAPPEPTHIFEVFIRPYSWYTPGTALDVISLKLADITGALFNLFRNITDFQYIRSEVTLEGNNVVIRSFLRSLTPSPTIEFASPYRNNLINLKSDNDILQTLNCISVLSPIAFVPLILVISALVLTIGPIVHYAFRDIFRQLIGQKTFTNEEVSQIIFGGGEFGIGVVGEQLNNCDTNFANDPVGKSNCYKAVLCGGADGTTDSLGLRGTDCTSQQINQKIDTCLAQYQIDLDLVKYNTCLTNVRQQATTNIQTEAIKKDQQAGTGQLLILGLLGLGVLGLFLVSRGPPKITIGK